MLSEAKNLGCKAFALRGSVDLDAFATWLETQPDFKTKWAEAGAVPDKGVSDAWKAHFEKELRRIRVEKENRKLIARADRADQVRSIASRARQIAEIYIADRDAKALFMGEMKKLAEVFET